MEKILSVPLAFPLPVVFWNCIWKWKLTLRSDPQPGGARKWWTDTTAFSPLSAIPTYMQLRFSLGWVLVLCSITLCINSAFCWLSSLSQFPLSCFQIFYLHPNPLKLTFKFEYFSHSTPIDWAWVWRYHSNQKNPAGPMAFALNIYSPMTLIAIFFLKYLMP